MLDKVKLVEDRYEELSQLMADPEVVMEGSQRANVSSLGKIAGFLL